MVRPFRWETDRYGEYSKIGEFVYDHPFQWGSRRTGPDLARAGVESSSVYKNAAWHFKHFTDPASFSKKTIMPTYGWFTGTEIDLKQTPAKIRAMQTLGVPYPEGFDTRAVDDLKAQGQKIADELKAGGVTVSPTSEMVAMIAYLHKMGKDITAKKK
jgi:cytochrome c oxidase cbb3-type subunit I/II